MMNRQNTLPFLSAYEYADYLEKLSDEEFWQLARDKADTSRRTSYPSAPTASYDELWVCIACSLREARCIVPLTNIREILPPSQSITLLPDMPHWMLGILAWRGETIAVIDLCAYLTKKHSPCPMQRVTLIVQHEGLALAFCVLAIDATFITIDPKQIVLSQPSMFSVDIVGMWEATARQVGEMGKQNLFYVMHLPAFFLDIVQGIEREKARE